MTKPICPDSLRSRTKASAYLVTLSTAGLLLALGTSISCKDRVVNEMHCFYNGGNAECERRYGDALPYCGTICLDRDGNPPSPNIDGCIDWLPPDGCYSPCGDVDVTEDDSCLDASTGTTTESATEPTGPTTTMPTTTVGPTTTADSSGTETTEPTSMTDTDTGPSGCATSDECTDPLLPLCADEVCVSCQAVVDGDDQCGAKDDALPACGADGNCVECTATLDLACAGETPICDANAQACRGCIAHDECDGTACEFATGGCFDEGCVLDVPGDAATIAAAVGMVPANEACVLLLGEAGLNDFNESVTINGGRRVAFRNGGDTEIRILGGGTPTIAVSGGAAAYIDRVRISQGGAQGVSVAGDGTLAYLEQATVVGNAGGGITVTSGGYVRVRNSIIGGDVSDVAAISIPGGSADIFASTLFAGFGDANALTCGGAGDATVRNSIVVARTDSPEIACVGVDVSYTATEAPVGGDGNEDLGDVSNTWFVSVGAGDFHLSATGAALVADVAQWITGDAAEDIDGDPRVAVDGSMEHAGADVP